ncbi:hypothetical protein [Vannielia sp. SX4]|uniref:hypothetical protein n=1 Tax=Vannielia sp. SX4 TaxID=3463852 RepID=UPI004058577C
MIELAFVTCLATSPTDCENRSLLFQEGTPMSCMMTAQPQLAQWINEHPNWTIARWKCRAFKPGEGAYDI